MANAIHIIAPYRFEGTWVFDDPSVGLTREPFVAGVPEMIDTFIKELPEDVDQFRLLFSEQPFAGYSWDLVHDREEFGGHWYKHADPDLEGWLCPAMFEYFDTAPERIYLKAELNL